MLLVPLLADVSVASLFSSVQLHLILVAALISDRHLPYVVTLEQEMNVTNHSHDGINISVPGLQLFWVIAMVKPKER